MIDLKKFRDLKLKQDRKGKGVLNMSENIKSKVAADPFWEKNSKLSIEEIEEKFSEKTAEALKLQKKIDALTEK